jgi:hypothetical protein
MRSRPPGAKLTSARAPSDSTLKVCGTPRVCQTQVPPRPATQPPTHGRRDRLRGSRRRALDLGRHRAYRGVRDVARRLTVDVALLHLGGVRLPVTGPARYTMTARDAVELCRSLRPPIAIPVHYEGWAHFREDRAAAERELAAAPQEVCWLPIGEPVEP